MAHFAVAARLIIGLRVVIAAAGPLAVRTTATLATRSIPYLVGASAGSFVIWSAAPQLLLITALLKAVVLPDFECLSQCQELADYNDNLSSAYDELNSYCTDYTQNYKSSPEYQSCYSQYLACKAAGGVYCGGGCADLSICPRTIYDYFDFPEMPHSPDQCDCSFEEPGWIQIVYGQLEDDKNNNQIISPQGCWVVGYSYDIDNNLTIEYNPGLNEDFVRFKALKPNQVQDNDNVSFDDLESLQDNSYKGSETFDRSFWAAQSVDVECRKWQPGKIIPTK